ncbi:YibE/F family protein, partial [Candidatus Uhrbacteria bacterium]|nr:YibE/F family protein [Candidatus Uhrbacteria bacterium]
PDPTGYGATQAQGDGSYERAIVRAVAERPETSESGATLTVVYTVEFLSGPLKGSERDISGHVASNPYDLELRQGDRIVVFLQPNPSGSEPYAYIEGFDRLGAIIWLVVLFVATLILLAGWQGIKVAFSIAISISLIGFVLIPSFLKGVNPVPVAMVLSVVFTAVASVLAMGWNRKSWVTIAGTFGGVVVAFLISYVFGEATHLQGLSTEEDRLFFGKNPLLDPRGLMFAGIIVAAMGVVEDVAVSIASGTTEISRANPRLGFKELFRSGMVIGRDHMGAMANTLILAYVGASLSTILLYTQYGGSWLKFLNFDMVTDEIVRSLSGTIGLVFTVPITALLAAMACARPAFMKPEETSTRRIGGWRQRQ